MDVNQRSGAGTPEISTKLLHRFYEAIGLLHALGTARGERTHKTLPSHEQVDSLTAMELRRHFLDELAFLCDHKKGGDTVTAIGLEHTPQNYVFWVAANESPKGKIVPFLADMLLLLKDAHRSQDCQHLGLEIFKLSVTFAQPRIKTYAKFLLSDLDRLREFPACTDATIADQIRIWKDKLTELMEQDIHALVDFAYNERHSTFVRQLATLANDRHYKSSSDSLQATCTSARHNIGRLGLHARSAQSLALYTPRMRNYLDSYSVQAVPVFQKGNVRPQPRQQTTADAALGRMMSDDKSKLKMYRQALVQMDAPFKISERFRKAFSDSKNKTRIHAEVQVLHHFNNNVERFADDDKYIACSKPACFCCLLYFRHHPGGYVEPRSHHKIYLNWQPPGVFESVELGEENKLRDILNQMAQDIRRDALRQIVERAGPRKCHPDSVTGISASILDAPELDTVSITAEDAQDVEEYASGSSGYSSFESDNAVALAPLEAQPNIDSDTDNEEGGVSLI